MFQKFLNHKCHHLVNENINVNFFFKKNLSFPFRCCVVFSKNMIFKLRKNQSLVIYFTRFNLINYLKKISIKQRVNDEQAERNERETPISSSFTLITHKYLYPCAPIIKEEIGIPLNIRTHRAFA